MKLGKLLPVVLLAGAYFLTTRGNAVSQQSPTQSQQSSFSQVSITDTNLAHQYGVSAGTLLRKTEVDHIITQLTQQEYARLQSLGTLSGGEITKLRNLYRNIIASQYGGTGTGIANDRLISGIRTQAGYDILRQYGVV